MAPSKIHNESSETSSTTNDGSQISDADDDILSGRPAKRRKLSESSEESFTPLPPSTSISRIKKSRNVPEPTSLAAPLANAIQTTNTTFASLHVAPWLIASLSTMAIKRPTAIQKACIPEILKGRDCIGGSRTGSGKTVAFAVPILQKWAEDPVGIFAVVLTPTRELALQIFEQFKAISAPQSFKSILITGGTELRPQAIALSQRPHVVIATPGRLADHILNSGTDTIIGLRRAQIVVLDEADRLLASRPGSMLPDLETCLSALPSSTSRQTLLFTATVTPEVRELKFLLRPPSRPPIFITEILTSSDITIPRTLKQTYLQVPLTHRHAFLHILLSTPLISQFSGVIIFVNRTKTADLLERILRRLDHRVTSLHSLLPQSQRTANLSRFRASAARLLVATDVAARGLDIPSIGLVINFDVPRNPDDYIHRVGRTARAGREGEAITLIGQRDVSLVLAIEERVGRKMEEWREEGVNVESRVVKGGVLKEVGQAMTDSLREIEEGRDVSGRRKKGLKRIDGLKG